MFFTAISNVTKQGLHTVLVNVALQTSRGGLKVWRIGLAETALFLTHRKYHPL